MKKTDSSALHLLSHVWKHAMEVTGHSWRRLNASMQDALHLAISSGMKFDRDDFIEIENRFRFGYWGGINNAHNFGERWYSLSIEQSNLSASLAFEKWKGRKPFIFIEIRSPFRKKGRLALGSRFHWKKEWVDVTSFAEDGSHLIACAFHRYVEGRSRTVMHRHTITPQDLKEERRRLEKSKMDYDKVAAEMTKSKEVTEEG